MTDESVETTAHGIDIEQKQVTEVIWDGCSMKIDDVLFLTAPLDEAVPDWVRKAAESKKLKHGRIGWLELREGGSVKFQEADRYV